jgi:uncharacterized repeat protein (TIGR03943 family)
MKRETENVMLLLVGVSIAMITASGAFTRYVKPALLPWLIATAVLLIVLAFTAIIGDIRRGGPRPHGDDDHTHRGRIGWLLLIPIVVLIFVAPPALQPGRSTPSVSVAANNLSYQEFPAIPAGRAPEVSLPDVMLRAVNDKSGSLQNRLITVTGFVLHETDGVDLGRIVIICCAADAQLARLHLRGADTAVAAHLADNTWARVEGVVTPAARQPNTAPIPTLTATAVVPVDAPPNPYAYPG